MNTYARIKCSRTLAVVAAAVLLSVCWPASAAAAEPDFVGVLAMMAEEEVADELKLTQSQVEKLKNLIAAREDDEELTELVLQLEDLPPAERQQKLAPFRRESERLGLALLSPQQRARLRQIRIRRLGLTSLGEPAIAEWLKLSEEQQTQIADLLKQRAEQLARADHGTTQVIRAETGRKLHAVLTDQQRSTWEALTTTRRWPERPSPEPADVVADQPAKPTEPGDIVGDEPTQPADVVPDEPSEPSEVAKPAKKPGKLRFSFQHPTWKSVIDWFAQQADLSLVTDTYPTGTLNYLDDRDYTPTEALDVINSVLLTKGYTLVRRNRALMLINLEDGIPPNLVSFIRPEELDQRGEFELVGVLFDLDKFTPEEAETEVKKLIGPQGSVVPLPKSRQIQVIETAGHLRAIQRVIQRVEYPEGPPGGEMRPFPLKYAFAEDVLVVIRQLLDVPADQNAAPDGSFRFAVDPSGDRLLVSGKPEKLARVKEILDMVDVPGNGPVGLGGKDEAPHLVVYPVTTADPEAVLAVMQTLLAGLPDVRLATDPKTGSLVAYARPSQHKMIKATLEQLQRDARVIEVIHLHTVDPQLAVLAINKLFGAGGEKPDPNAPQVDADPTTGTLLIRATATQIEQIGTLLKKMGETDTGDARTAGGGNVRMLPLKGRAATSALERIQQIWPTMRRNRIRIVTPSTDIPSMLPGSLDELKSGTRIPVLRLPATRTPASRTPSPDQPGEARPGEMRPGEMRPGPMPSRPMYRRPMHRGPDVLLPNSTGVETPPREDKSTGLSYGARVLFASRPLILELGQLEPEPAGPEPEVPQPAQPDPAVPKPPEPRPKEPEPTVPEPTVPEPAVPEPTVPEPTVPEPTVPEPTVPEPVQPEPDVPKPAEPDSAAPLPVPPRPDQPKQPEDPREPEAAADEPPTIIVALGPGGIMIASADIEALDEFEQLLTTLAGNMMAGGGELTIFYLKHVKATVAAETLDQIFGGGTIATDSGGSGGGLIGDLAGAALGGGGGGILGSLLGLGGDGGTIAPSGTIRITPDTRLNALIVQANPLDLDTIEQLLKILDQKESPEDILVMPKAKLIPVINTQAEEIAGILKEVYQDRMVAGPSTGGRRPSPEEFMQMLRGGRGGRGGGSSRSRTEELQKMSMSVDPRTNSIIVAAPEPLLQEVAGLVQQLDRAAVETVNQTTRVVRLHKASSEAVEQALSALVGDSVRFGRTTASKPTTASTRPPSSQPTPSSGRPPSSGYRPPSGYRPSSSYRPGSSGSSRPSIRVYSRPSTGSRSRF